MALVHQQIQEHHWKALLFGAKQLLAGYSNTHDRTRNNSTRKMPSLNYRKFRLARENNQTSWGKNIMKCTWLSNEHTKLRVQGCLYIQICPSKASMPIYKVPSVRARGRQHQQPLNPFLGIVGTQPNSSWCSAVPEINGFLEWISRLSIHSHKAMWAHTYHSSALPQNWWGQ